MPDRPLKVITHNHLLPEEDGGEEALVRAAEMGIDLVRIDLRWRHMDTPEGWLWEAEGPNRWTDLVEPALRWTREHGMRTVVNLLAYKAPSHSMTAMNGAWEARTGQRALDGRDCALWAAWAAGNGVDLGAPTPREFTRALLSRLAEGQRGGEYDVAAFCVLNEPNTVWPAEDNWRKLQVGGGYTTADMCRDLCSWVKGSAGGALGHAVNVVNLYAYRRHWRDPAWAALARGPDVDVLGIDIYTDQALGLYVDRVPEAMGELSREVGKPWWLVETGGADGPGWFLTRPSCADVRLFSERCAANGAGVLGYYRLWGDRGGRLAYGAAYDVFTRPGRDPVPRTDATGAAYWEAIRDV